jgi:nitroreductase
MNFISLIAKRRSVRRFKNKKIESHKIDTLIEAVLRAPSSRGGKPWEFIVVNDRGVLEKLSKAKPHGAAFLANAALGIIVCANADQSDVWVEDAAIASIYLHLAATSLGLGSCWIQIRKRMHDDNKTAQAYVAEVLGIPQDLKVESIVAIGHPDEEKSAHPKEQLPYQKAHMNRYGRKYDMN